YAVLSLRPPTVALAVPPPATEAPEPLEVPVNAVPTALTSTSSRTGELPAGPDTVALKTADRLVSVAPGSTAVTPSLWNSASAAGGPGGGLLPAATKSTGTRSGIPIACAADTRIVSAYSPGPSPRGRGCPSPSLGCGNCLGQGTCAMP